MALRILFEGTVPKHIDSPDDNEDAYRSTEDKGRIVLSDGASESFDARSWSRVVVDHFLDHEPADEEVGACAQAYALLHDPSTLSWSKAAAHERGSFATLVIAQDDPDRRVVNITALGDSLAVWSDGSRVLETAPYIRADQFVDKPTLLATRPEMNAAMKIEEAGPWLCTEWAYETQGSHLLLCMAGTDSLTVSMDIKLTGLKPLLRRYLKAFQSTAYKTHFSWIDQIHQVRKKGHVAETLNALLIERLNMARAAGGVVDGCWMAVPDVLDWAAIAGFRFSQKTKDGMMTDMHLPGFMDSLKEDDVLTIELLKMRSAYAVNDDHHEVQHWSVYKCIHCELDHEERSYLLSGGQWFEVNKGFVKAVDEFYGGLPKYAEPLLDYKYENEGAYNKALVASDPVKWAPMDAKPIAVGGIYDKVEFCDVYSINQEMLHVKRYGGSNVLGHLFNQGLVSGQLLRDHKDYVKLANRYLPDSHKLDDDAKIPRDVSAFKIIFAIISQSDEPELHIPFFARVALKNVHKQLESIGFTNIMLAKVSCEPGFKKLVKLKPTKDKL